jgi:predicted HTH domain antitoxin
VKGTKKKVSIVLSEKRHRRKAALDSYREGLISLGKVAEILGLDPVSARRYLKEKGIPIRSQDLPEIQKDADNA